MCIRLCCVCILNGVRHPFWQIKYLHFIVCCVYLMAHGVCGIWSMVCVYFSVCVILILVWVVCVYSLVLCLYIERRTPAYVINFGVWSCSRPHMLHTHSALTHRMYSSSHSQSLTHRMSSRSTYTTLRVTTPLNVAPNIVCPTPRTPSIHFVVKFSCPIKSQVLYVYPGVCNWNTVTDGCGTH